MGIFHIDTMTESVIANININNNRKGMNVLDCPSAAFIRKTGEFFKERNLIKLPKWAHLVKTSHGNEIVPIDNDWFFYKAAAIARQIYISRSQNIGVGSLKAFFGRKKRNGVRPPRFIRAGGKIIREIVHQLKNACISKTGLKTKIQLTV